MSFQNTQFLSGLLLLLPLGLLFFYVLKWKQEAKRKLGDVDLVNQLTKTYSPKKFNLKFILLMVAMAALIIATANLRKLVPGKNENKAGIDVMIALDVSKSMWAEDLKPSRLELAKQFTNDLIDGLDNNKVGLVLFAGRAFLQMPLTTDLSIAKLYISNASPDAVPVQGTAIGNALQLCANSLVTKQKKFKAVVLISDGEDHDPHSENILKSLADNGVIINTIGVGTADGAPIKEPGASGYKTDADGKTVISKLNEKELMDIAQQTGGTYINLTDAAAASAQVASVLNSMEKKSIENKGDVREYNSLYFVFVLAALLLLIAEVFISDKKIKTA